MSNVSIGEEIRAARKGADLTIAEVADRAKLRSAVLEAIENDDFSLCGGDTYARGHLKVIAGILKIDSVSLLEKFDEKFGKFETALLDLSEKGKRNLEKPSKSTKASWKTLSMIAVAVIALVTVVQISGSSPKNEVVSATSESETPPSAEQPIPACKSRLIASFTETTPMLAWFQTISWTPSLPACKAHVTTSGWAGARPAWVHK